MKRKQHFLMWVLFAIVLGIIAGIITPKEFRFLGIHFYAVYDLLGKLFIRILMLVVVPLVSASVITSLAKIGKKNTFKGFSFKIIITFIVTNLLAILVGVLVYHLFLPLLKISALTIQSTTITPEALKTFEVSHGSTFLSQFILHVIPASVIEAFVGTHMIGLISFSIIFGYAISKIKTKATETLLNFWKGIFEAMLFITHKVMRLLPLAVFALIAKDVSATGFDSIKSLFIFAITILIGLAIYVLIVLPLILKFIVKISPIKHFKAMFPALITAFSTSSSAATIPVAIDCLEKRAKISNKICSLVIPLGTSLNMAGSALFAYVASMFLALIYGIDFSIGTHFLIILLTFVSTIGVAGIPSAAIVCVIIIIKSFNLPAEAIGIFLTIDRILDMLRTTTNIFTASASSAIIAKLEGETKILKNEIPLNEN